MLEKFTLRTQILISFAVLSTISLLIISSVNIGNITILGNQTRDLTTEALEDQITRNILTSSTENSRIIERKIDRLVGVVESVASATELLFAESDSLEYLPSYFDYDDTTIPANHTDLTQYRNVVSFENSVYYIPGSTPANLSTYLADQETSYIINTSAHLDNYFRPQFETNDNFYWMYIGFTTPNKVFRVFPGTIWNETRNYDHTVRPWYLQARSANGVMIITDPYKGAISQKWMITVARTIYYSDGGILGVAAGDILIDDIQEKVLEISFLDSGYATLYLAEEGNEKVVYHPDWEYNQTDSSVLITDTDIEPSLTSETLKDFRDATTTNVITINKDGEKYFVANSKIKDRYILLIIVPHDEAVASVKKIDSEISESQDDVTRSTIILSLLTLLIVLGVGLWLANIVTRPIQRLTKMALQITRNVNDEDLLAEVDLGMSLDRDDEIGELTQSFSKMVEHLRNEQDIKKKSSSKSQ